MAVRLELKDKQKTRTTHKNYTFEDKDETHLFYIFFGIEDFSYKRKQLNTRKNESSNEYRSATHTLYTRTTSATHTYIHTHNTHIQHVFTHINI